MRESGTADKKINEEKEIGSSSYSRFSMHTYYFSFASPTTA